MKKNLLNEIYRIKEVMGVSLSKPLILEDSIIKRLSTNIKNIFSGSNPNIRMSGRNTPTGPVFNFNLPNLNKVVTATNKEVNDMVKYLDNNLSWNDLTDNSKKFFKDILSEIGNLDGTKIYDDLIDGIIAGGSDEEVWLRNVIRASRLPNRQGREVGLKNALMDILGDEEGIMTDYILSAVSKKIDDYDKKLLRLEKGKLVRGIASDVDDFLVNARKFTKDELRILSNPSFVSKIKSYFGIMQNEYIQLKNLFKNLDDERLESYEKDRVKQLILKKMNFLANHKVKCMEEMRSFITTMKESGQPEAVRIANELLELEKKNGSWDVVKLIASQVSPLKQQWIALKEALKSAFSSEIKFVKGVASLPSRAKYFFSKAQAQQDVETAVKASEGSFKNYLWVTSPRGWPTEKIINALETENIDYFAKLKSMGGLGLARTSYLEEYLIRLWKFNLYINLIKLQGEQINYYISTREEKECLLQLSRVMRTQKIYNAEYLEQPYKQKAEWLVKGAPCIYKMNPEKINQLFLAADYMTSLGSEDGRYWRKEFKEKLTDVSFAKTLLKLQPIRAAEIAVEAANLYESFMDSKDLQVIEPPKPEELIYGETEEDFKFWSEAFKHTYEKWDKVTKRGFADGKKWKLQADKHGFEEDKTTPTPVVTTDTEEIKNQLFNHLKTIPSLNNNPDPKKRIGLGDKPYIFDRGNNIWEFEASGDSIMKFQYNPQTKTFSQIR